MSASSYCINGSAVLPSDNSQPPICIYSTDGLKGQFYQLDPTFTVLDFATTTNIFEYDINGTALTGTPANIKTFKSILIPPNVSLELYSDSACTALVSTLNGSGLEQLLGAGSVNTNLTDIKCIKNNTTVGFDWNTFIERCKIIIPNNICVHHQTFGDFGLGTVLGDNKVPDKKTPPKNHSWTIVIVALVFLFIIIVVGFIWYNHPKTAIVGASPNGGIVTGTKMTSVTTEPVIPAIPAQQSPPANLSIATSI